MKRSRRVFLGLLGGAGVAALAGRVDAVRAQAAAPPKLAVTELRDGLHLISGAGGNIVARRHSGSLLLVDSGSPESASALRALLRERFAAAPLDLLFNTHWHLEHTGGNEALRRPALHDDRRAREHAAVDEHGVLRRLGETDLRRRARASSAQQDVLLVGSAAARSRVRRRGRSSTAICAKRTRTATSTCGFPSRNVIVAGGAVTAASIRSSTTSRAAGSAAWSTRRTKLLDMTDADTLIVPDDGPAQRRADLEAQLEMLRPFASASRALRCKGRSIEEMLAAGDHERVRRAVWRRRRARSSSNAYEGMWWSRLRGIVA